MGFDPATHAKAPQSNATLSAKNDEFEMVLIRNITIE